MLLPLLGAEGGIVFQSPRAIEKSLTALGTALASSRVQAKSLRLRLVGHVPRPRPVRGFPCWASFARLFRPIKKTTCGAVLFGGGAATPAKPHQLGAFLLAKAAENIRGKTLNQSPVYQMRCVVASTIMAQFESESRSRTQTHIVANG